MTVPASAVGKWLWTMFARHETGARSIRQKTASPRYLMAFTLAGCIAVLADPFNMLAFLPLLPIVLYAGMTTSALGWLLTIFWAFISTPSFTGKGSAFLEAVLPVLAGSGCGLTLKRKPGTLLGLVYAATPICLLALAQWVWPAAIPEGWLNPGERWILPTRVTGIYGNPNLFACVLLFLIPFGWAAGIGMKRKAVRWGLSGWLALAVLALVLTFSYMAWIAALFELVLFGVLIKKEISRRSLIGVGLLTFLAMLLLTALHHGETAEYRLKIWEAVKNLWLQHPWGTGPGGFAYFYPMAPGAVPADHAHNLFLQVLSEEGPVGIGVLLMIGFSVLRRTQRACGKWSYASVAALAGQAVFGLADYIWATPLMAGLFWLAEATIGDEPQEEMA